MAKQSSILDQFDEQVAKDAEKLTEAEAPETTEAEETTQPETEPETKEAPETELPESVATPEEAQEDTTDSETPAEEPIEKSQKSSEKKQDKQEIGKEFMDKSGKPKKSDQPAKNSKNKGGASADGDAEGNDEKKDSVKKSVEETGMEAPKLDEKLIGVLETIAKSYQNVTSSLETLNNHLDAMTLTKPVESAEVTEEAPVQKSMSETEEVEDEPVRKPEDTTDSDEPTDFVKKSVATPVAEKEAVEAESDKTTEEVEEATTEVTDTAEDTTLSTPEEPANDDASYDQLAGLSGKYTDRYIKEQQSGDKDREYLNGVRQLSDIIAFNPQAPQDVLNRYRDYAEGKDVSFN